MSDEGGATWAQAARWGSQCRVFAPVYRSFTLPGLLRKIPPLGTPLDPVMFGITADLEPPCADVLDAWRHYLAHEDHGRGVILLGHSQGSELLHQLLQEEIDPDPRLRDRLVAAYVIGATVHVPAGKAAGGDFQHIPVCRVPWQTGCIVTYGAYRATVPRAVRGRRPGRRRRSRSRLHQPGGAVRGPALPAAAFPAHDRRGRRSAARRTVRPRSREPGSGSRAGRSPGRSRGDADGLSL